MIRKSGFVKPLLIAVLCLLGIIASAFFWFNGATDENLVDNQLLFTAFKGEFVSTITEPGEVESSSNVEIRCEVKSRSSGGTAIIKIVPEGTFVQKGDFLVQFDDTTLRDRLIEQQILVAQNEASLIQAENDLSAARKMVEEYDKGTYNQELETINSEIAVAGENLKRAEEYLKFSSQLSAKSFITRTQLQADEFSVTKAAIELNLATQKREVLINFTKSRTEEQFQAEVKKLEASLKAARSTLLLAQAREVEFRTQVDKCRIIAPKSGQVVYANENDRDNSIIIEDGSIIRDGQEVIYLPDPNKMQVRTKVNDSKINFVKKGNEVEIRMDSAPDEVITGVVREVATFPMPQRWYQAPIEYEVFVDVTDTSGRAKSGLRAKAKIIVDRKQDSIQIPASAIVRHNGEYFVIAVEAGRYVSRNVELGSNNDKFVVVESGVSVGDEVLINPEKQKEKVEFPET